MYSKLGTILILLVSFQVQAKEFLICINNNYDKQVVDIPQLDDKNTFEDDHFKIVFNQDDTAIKTDTKNYLLKLKAATTFYHLYIARDYFVKLMKENFPSKRKKLVVRIDIARGYDKKEKYFKTNEKDKFNTALSIPPNYPKSKKKWGHEIWFRPANFMFKKINSNVLIDQGLAMYDVLVKSSHYIDSLRIIDKVIKDETDDIDQDLTDLAESFALDKAKRFGLEFILNKINYGIAYRESALNNEIIYHEYTHIVLSNFISIRSPLSMGEGIASYFATQISHGQNIATRYGRYSIMGGKEAYTEHSYSPDFEKEKHAQEEFSYSLFYQVGKIIDEDLGADYKSADYFFNIIKELDVRYPLTVYPGFTDLLVSGCNQGCLNPFTTRIKLNYLMHSMGI